MLLLVLGLLLLALPVAFSDEGPSNSTFGYNDETKRFFSEITSGVHYLGDFPAHPATSCQQVSERRPKAMSGYYWIQNGCCPSQVYCAMNKSECGSGVWTEIANINMSIPSTMCPKGLEKVSAPKSCRKKQNSGCSSTIFSTFRLPYQKVCGKIIGYQFNTPDAFEPYATNNLLTVNDGYADGVLLSYNNPREHIWTFTAQRSGRAKNDLNGCPCLHAYKRYAGKVPRFVGNDFFCETGDHAGELEPITYTTNKLWDGKGCGTFPRSCEGTRDPWFKQKYSYVVNSDIEVRVCLNQGRADEDLLIEQIYLYVQ